MRRAIVHVGMPRTASTTIQHVLAHRRAALAEAGILYPELTPASARNEPHISHQHLGEALDGRRPAQEARALLAELSAQLATTTADAVVLSYEDWIQEKRAGQIGTVLRETFARHGFAMEAIVVAKPQSEHLNSLYSHRAQLMLERRLFGAFCRRFEAAGRFRYAELLSPWLSVCQGRVQGLPLRDARSAAPLITRFLDAAGLSDRVVPLLAGTETERVENRSPGPVAVETSRRLRQLRVPSRLSVRPRVMMREIERRVREQGFDAVPFKGADPALRTRLAERYAATNDRFARAVWGQGWDSVVAPEPAHAVNEIGGAPADPETEQVIAETMREVCTEFGTAPVADGRRWLAETAEEAAVLAQRLLRLSRWRVL